MQYIKCKFIIGGNPAGRSYTYKCEDDVTPGDTVVDAKGSKLIVVDEPVDVEWIRVYGINKVAAVKKEPAPAIVKEWSLTYSCSKYTAPELRIPQLAGKIFGSDKFRDGADIVTSGIRKIEQYEDSKVIITNSGSRYRIYPNDINPEYENMYPDAYHKIKSEDVK